VGRNCGAFCSAVECKKSLHRLGVQDVEV
jgi:hypothetical protein